MKQLIAIFAFALVAACGFKPVYSTGLDGNYDGAISVEKIPGRSGYMLRRALQEELAAGLPGIAESATLKVTLEENLSRLTFKPDGAASRSSVVARGRYMLFTDQDNIAGSVQTDVNFAVPDSPYGDIASQTGAADRAMRTLAKRIVDDLRLKLTAD